MRKVDIKKLPNDVKFVWWDLNTIWIQDSKTDIWINIYSLHKFSCQRLLDNKEILTDKTFFVYDNNTELRSNKIDIIGHLCKIEFKNEKFFRAISLDGCYYYGRMNVSDFKERHFVENTWML